MFDYSYSFSLPRPAAAIKCADLLFLFFKITANKTEITKPKS